MCYAVLLTEACQVTPADRSGQRGSYLQNVGFSQNMITRPLTPAQTRVEMTWMTFADGATTLGGCIADVVELRSYPQVVWTDTGRVIAGVHDDQANRDGAKHPIVDEAVSGYGPSFVPKAPVANASPVPSPDPTVVGLIDVIPERYSDTAHVQHYTKSDA